MEDKYEALTPLDKKELDRKGLCAKYNIANSTISGWVADKEKIFASIGQGKMGSKRKRFRPTNCV
jgi:hypothetical protein